MSSETATPALPMTREQMRARLASIEAEVQELRRALDFDDGVDVLNQAMRSIDRDGGRPGLQALADLRSELGLPARDGGADR